MTFPILLAPIQGITNTTFRTVYASLFPGLTGAVAPFIPTATGNLPGPAVMKEIDPRNNPPSLPLIPQILGNDGADFLEVARFIRDQFGYEAFNWNIGCPVGTVSARKRGAGLLTHPDLIEGFLETVFQKAPGKVSLKMRLGMDSPREWEALVPVLNRFPLDFIVVHCRTGIQGYRGHADADMFGELSSRITRPLYYNGDLCTPAEAEKTRGRFPGLAGVMIGRGLVADPLLPKSVGDGSSWGAEERRKAFWKLHDGLFEAYGESLQPGAAVERMKEFLGYGPFRPGDPLSADGADLGAGLRQRERALRQILKTRRWEDYRREVGILRALG